MLYAVFSILLLTLLSFLLWPVRRHREFCLVVGALFFAAAFGLYAFIGSPELVPLMEARQERIEDIKASMAKNSAVVKSDPKNLTAWIALGQAFVETGQWDAAANAFKQAVLLSNGNPKLIMAYAKALILRADGQVSLEAEKSLEMVLLQEPEHEEARYWLAMRELQDGHTETAMKMMKALYRSLPDDSPVKALIDSQIGRGD